MTDASVSFSFDAADHLLVQALCSELGCSEAFAWILARRGISVEQAVELLQADAVAETNFHDPWLMGDMHAAVERIHYAIEHDEMIFVHGDYDADGVCSTTLLVEALEALGARTEAFLPNRFTNGYGLQLDTVERAHNSGVRLLITVDCGITSIEPVAQARDHGIDVIVCDHHVPGAELPDAIIASAKPGPYPFPEVCATVVAGKLAQALGAPYGPAQYELEAIATIADCMPLVGENRAIVVRGVAAARATVRPGLRELCAVAGVSPRDIDADVIAFKLAPRINAAGRLGTSERGYELLRADSATAPQLARILQDCNDERRRIEGEVSAQAIAQIESWTPQQRAAHIYVVHGRDWHEGVVGIVASRIVERFHRPAVVISEADPWARGSARSMDGIDLHAALASADDVLERWGGHAAAGGVTLQPDHIELFRQRMTQWGEQHIAIEQLAPRVGIDAHVAPSEIDAQLRTEIERLAPFGTGNPRPMLLAAAAQIEGPSAVGADGSHLRCRVVHGTTTVAGIAFGLAPILPELRTAPAADVAFRLTINRFRGVESLQAEIAAIRPCNELETEHNPSWTAIPSADQGISQREIEAAVSASDTPPDVSTAAQGELPAIEPLLARERTVDLRHTSQSDLVIRRLVSSGARIVVICADVSRRRDHLRPLLQSLPLSQDTAAIINEWSTTASIEERLSTLPALHEPCFILTEHAAAERVMAAAQYIDAVVVLDPPMTDAQRDLLASTDATLYLTFGAAEMRFAIAAATAMNDVRTTFGASWRTLRDTGPQRGEHLAQLLRGTGTYPHAASAIAIAISSLQTRGLVHVELDGSIHALEPRASVETGHSG